MRVSLRWKILLFAALAPVALALGTLWTVNRTVSSHLQDSIHESLSRSSRVFENMLSARASALSVAAEVIVRDPRFFSILTLPATAGDPEYRATVRGVARDFQAITQSDLFEVTDRQGRVIASVGRAASTPSSRGVLVRRALGGRAQTGLLVERDRHYQVTVTPALAGGHVVGALVLGAEIGGRLAGRLRGLTHSEVTFVSGHVATGSTLAEPADREAVLQAAEGLEDGPRTLGQDTILEVQGASRTYLTLVQRIPGSRPGDRQFYAMQRSLDVENAFLRRVRSALSQLGMLAILAALAMGFIISERITRPVQRLVRGAEEMERGNYDFPLGVRGRDEIGYLADRFQEMRQHEKDYVGSLEEVARLKSEFIAIASHELRTPISVIKGFLELFTQGSLGSTTAEQQGALAAIDRSLKHLTRIAEDATRVAQIESERLTLNLLPHGVEDLVRQAVSVAAGDAPNRNLTITSEVEPELGPARVDGPRLVQAVANLVRNGIRFTPDGGTIAVRAWRDDATLVIEVRDTGVGIGEDGLKDLFSRSYVSRDPLHHHSSSTLEFQSAGLGFGLTMVRAVVEAHGGTVTATSREGAGSLFTIRVPYHGAERMSQAA